ncbi:MAG TPA: hypothetical protein VKZ84_04400 [Bacteriovoracaceae bacterium]|nr:hypothetical protein [Bacteriovoracaceae bacterium]
MITVEEPKAREYTPEESELLKHKFITLLYTLLIVYLTLHQFLIPLVNNLFKGLPFASDIHWYFVIHFYGHYKLRKDRKLPYGFYALIWLMTILQIGVGFMSLGKWGLFSLAITQISTIIFLYFVWPFVNYTIKAKDVLIHIIVGGAIFAGIKSVEVKSVKPKVKSQRQIVLHQEDFVITFPNSFPKERELSVWNLGDRTFNFEHDFRIINDKDVSIDIRLYELHIKSERLRWKYKRLAQLKPNESWDLPLENDVIYLVKSPERKDLKVLLLIPQNYEFPLGPGELSVGFNSLEWRSQKNE